VALQSATANRLRDELGGMTGILRNEYNKLALAKSAADRTEYDYYALGHICHLHFDEEGVLCARKIWDQGLARYPDSALLRYKQSFTYMWTGNRGKKADYETQRRLVEEGAKLPNGSPLDEWYSHLAASLVHMTRNELDRAIVEAKASARIAPYDGLTQANVADIMDSALVYDDAIPFITFATTHDPNPLDWYFQDLIDIYSGANKWPDAIQLAEGELRDKPSPNRNWYKVLAVAYQQTGETKKSTEAWDKLANLPDPPAKWQPPPCESVLNQ
jgi:tetratricopeptide (TPR) repeat protein